MQDITYTEKRAVAREAARLAKEAHPPVSIAKDLTSSAPGAEPSTPEQEVRQREDALREHLQQQIERK